MCCCHEADAVLVFASVRGCHSSGIGEWERMFNRSAQWSVPIVVALIFITTGEV